MACEIYLESIYAIFKYAIDEGQIRVNETNFLQITNHVFMFTIDTYFDSYNIIEKNISLIPFFRRDS